MWIVAKIKNNNIETFKKEFSKKVFIENIQFYEPKFICKIFSKGKKIEKKKLLLENYIFCKHENFEKLNLKNLQFIKGLQFFLDGYAYSQKSIVDFIETCKTHEDDKGLIKNSFFKLILTGKGRFISGPFKNLVFDLIKKNKNNLKISVGNFLFTVSDEVKYIYRPV